MSITGLRQSPTLGYDVTMYQVGHGPDDHLLGYYPDARSVPALRGRHMTTFLFSVYTYVTVRRKCWHFGGFSSLVATEIVILTIYSAVGGRNSSGCRHFHFSEYHLSFWWNDTYCFPLNVSPFYDRTAILLCMFVFFVFVFYFLYCPYKHYFNLWVLCVTIIALINIIFTCVLCIIISLFYIVYTVKPLI